MTRTKRNTRTKALQNLKSLKNFAISTVEAARDAAISRAGEARAKTVQVMTQFEKAFEQRVSKTISRLGVPSSKEVRALSREVSQLKANVDKLRRSRARA
jgi:poly(hydroxyalkanoate) granule-associated protein